MRALVEKGPPCAVGQLTEGGRVRAVFCRFGGWLRDGGAADVLSRDYATTASVSGLLDGGHVVGIHRGQKPIAVPYINGGRAEVFENDTAYREHFARYGVSFFLLWDGGRWTRSRPGIANAFAPWCPVVGRRTQERRLAESET